MTDNVKHVKETNIVTMELSVLMDQIIVLKQSIMKPIIVKIVKKDLFWMKGICV